MPEFPVGNYLCSCRFGLNSENELCNHLETEHIENDISSFREHETALEKPSRLFQLLDMYIDNPEFWAHILDFQNKMQRNSKKWLRDSFISKSKSQLARLCGQKLDENRLRLFIVRIHQLLRYNRVYKQF